MDGTGIDRTFGLILIENGGVVAVFIQTIISGTRSLTKKNLCRYRTSIYFSAIYTVRTVYTRVKERWDIYF